VNRRPLHVDLFLVRMTEELTVDVPLVATGISLAIENEGGTLLHRSSTSGQGPAGPPAAVDRVRHRFARRLRRGDQGLRPVDPGDVTLLTDPEEIVAKVQAPRVEVEPEPVVAEGEEGEEGAAEGEAAAGEAAFRRRVRIRGVLGGLIPAVAAMGLPRSLSPLDRPR
jgi:hypothetical protein